MTFKTIEEALAHAQEVQWNSPIFDAERDISEEVFSERKNLCKSCEHLTNSNYCTLTDEFMPVMARSKYQFCILAKWVEIEKAPDPALPPEIQAVLEEPLA